MLSHSKFELALEFFQSNNGKECNRYTIADIGRIYLDHLLSNGDFERAGKLCLTIFGQNKVLWEEEVYKFAKVHQLRSISAYIPRGEVTLDAHIYEMILYEFLKLDPNGFLQLIKEWSSSLYNVAAVINMVLGHFLIHDYHNQSVLLEALAILYSHDGKYDKALAMYLKLKNKDVFQLIQKHQLHNSVYDMIEGLMDLDSDKTIQLLLDKDRISSEIIVEKLKNNPRFLYRVIQHFSYFLRRS